MLSSRESERAYVEGRSAEEGATILLPRDDLQNSIALVTSLAGNRQRLVALTHAALGAARHHAAESWYSRRAEWTHDAVARARMRVAPGYMPGAGALTQ